MGTGTAKRAAKAASEHSNRGCSMCPKVRAAQRSPQQLLFGRGKPSRPSSPSRGARCADACRRRGGRHGLRRAEDRIYDGTQAGGT